MNEFGHKISRFLTKSILIIKNEMELLIVTDIMAWRIHTLLFEIEQ
jgi:hypothetical protein